MQKSRHHGGRRKEGSPAPKRWPEAADATEGGTKIIIPRTDTDQHGQGGEAQGKKKRPRDQGQRRLHSAPDIGRVKGERKFKKTILLREGGRSRLLEKKKAIT